MGGEVDRSLPPPLPSPALRGRELRRRLAAIERRRRWRTVPLALPLLVFLVALFLYPLGEMLWKSVADREVSAALPETAASLARGAAIDDALCATLARELIAAREAGTLAAAARRLNYDVSGMRPLLLSSARRLAAKPASDCAALEATDPRWREKEVWAAIGRAAGPFTSFYLLSAVDLHRTAGGTIAHMPDEQAIYRDVLWRTFGTSAIVMLACLLLGFPVAYLIANLPASRAGPLLALVLLPFWTPILVRTAAWVVLLQSEGLVNGALVALGILDAPVQLVYNRIGVYVAMTHVLLPFMILPLYSVMRAIPPAYMRAALSLGAPPAEAFVRVYLPQAMPGIAAGCLLTFILAIGYYITPALVGGAGDQMIAYFIAFNVTDTGNWGLAAALGAVLLAATLALYIVYARLVGARAMRLG
jgi:putative spermidine/putrescine transport system permease protein